MGFRGSPVRAERPRRLGMTFQLNRETSEDRAATAAPSGRPDLKEGVTPLEVMASGGVFL